MVKLSIFRPPDSPIIYERCDTRAVLDNRDLGLGSLIISERTLCWKEQGGLGFSFDYTDMSMHSISKDPNLYPVECIFILLDGHLPVPGLENPQVNEDEDEESEPDNSQLIFIPPDLDSIQSIYTALNQCQLLNPDPEDAMSEEEDENVYEDAEEYNEEFVSNARLNDLGAGGDTEMNHLSTQMRSHTIHTSYTYGNGDQNFDDDQFEDAD